MSLPFDERQFLSVFAAYNEALWPFVVALWIASAAAAWLWTRHRPWSGRILGGLLSLLWIWSGVAYHFGFFRDINPAARLFAVLFLVQGLAFAWLTSKNRLHFESGSPFWSAAAKVLVVYALAYPLLVLASGFHYPAMPTFGVPCPTVLFTAGLLVSLTPGRRSLLVIPVLWCLIASSAAVLFGVLPDLALMVAALLMVVRAVPSRTWTVEH